MEDIISKFNLPSYIKGKSFAEASKIINKRSGDRTDVESVETKRELLDRLKQAQEFVKSQEEPQQGPSHQMPDGSMMPGESHGEEAPQSTYAYGGGVDQLKLNQMNTGGPTGGMFDQFANANMGGTGFQAGGAGAAGAGAAGGAAGGLSGGAGSAISAGGTMVGNLLKQKDPADSVIAGDAEQNAQMDQIQSGVAAAFGPVGMAVDGASKLVEGVGDRIGGDTGAYIAGIASPQKAIAATFQNKDASTGQKALSVIPGVGGIVAKNLADEAASEAHMEEVAAKHTEKDSIFANGGYTSKNMGQRKMEEGGFGNTETALQKMLRIAKEKAASGIEEGFGGTGTDYSSGLSNPTQFKGMDGRGKTYGDTQLGANGVKIGDEVLPSKDYKPGEQYDGKSGGDDSDKKKKGSPLEALRYAPSLMNMAQLAKLKKDGADVETLGRLNTRYDPQQVDEKAMQNAIAGQTSANRSAITNSGSGSAAATRANLLANNLQGTKALSSAQLAANQANAQDNVRGQNFNMGVDKTNLSQDNSEKDINARNKGAYDTQMSQLMSSLGDSAGAIGKEEMLKKFPELMGMDYNWKGKFKTSAYGGYIKKKKK
jgi:hypothetical protein